MTQYKKGSLSRQARRQAKKPHRRAQRTQKQHPWRPVKAGPASSPPMPAPRARGYLVTQFWEHFHLGELLHKAGVKQKLKGLPAITLMLVGLMFGVLNARSLSDLAVQARSDQVLLGACYVQALERKQLYRFLGQVKDEHYLSWMGEIVRELQRHPQTATRRDGVVIGDDTVVFKNGAHMPYVTLVYKSSGKRFGLGNIIVSTHYADDQKDYGLFFDFWRPTPAQIQAAKEARERKMLKVDQRKPADVARWLEHQVAQHQAPDLAILHGAQVGPVVVEQCETLQIPWLGVAAGQRQYVVARPQRTPTARGNAHDWLTRRYPISEWVELTDVGHRALLVGPSTVAGLGQVMLVLVEDLTDQERTLFVTRPADEAVLWARVELALSQSADADSARLSIMLDLLRRTRQAGVLAETAVFDRWFYVTGFLRQVLALGFARVVLKAKRNIRYGYQGKEQTIEQLERQIPARRYRQKTHRGQRVKLATLRVQHGELGRVKLVFVKELGAHNRIVQKYVLMCTDPQFPTDQVYRVHKWRWKIEVGYRELRQNHGFEEYHARDFNANFGHIALSFLSYLCVVVTRLMTPSLRRKTLGQIKHLVFDALVELERFGDPVRVKFSAVFLREIGLPAYCTRNL